MVCQRLQGSWPRKAAREMERGRELEMPNLQPQDCMGQAPCGPQRSSPGLMSLGAQSDALYSAAPCSHVAVLGASWEALYVAPMTAQEEKDAPLWPLQTGCLFGRLPGVVSSKQQAFLSAVLEPVPSVPPGAREKHTFLGPTADLLTQAPWGWPGNQLSQALQASLVCSAGWRTTDGEEAGQLSQKKGRKRGTHGRVFLQALPHSSSLHGISTWEGLWEDLGQRSGWNGALGDFF